MKKNHVRITYIPLIGHMAIWYDGFWPKCTTVETAADYAKGRGWKLQWDKKRRSLVMR